MQISQDNPASSGVLIKAKPPTYATSREYGTFITSVSNFSDWHTYLIWMNNIHTPPSHLQGCYPMVPCVKLTLAVQLHANFAKGTAVF